MICEINPWFLDGLNLTVEDLIGWFTVRGYDLYRYENVSRRLVPVPDPGAVKEDNYVFVHPRRAQRLSIFLGAEPDTG